MSDAPSGCGSPSELSSTAADPSVFQVARMWSGNSWRRYFFPAFWLVYLGQAVQGVGEHSHGAAAVIGYVIIVAFAVAYLAALPMGWNGSGGRWFWSVYAIAVALTVAGGFFAGADVLVFNVYLAVLTVAARRQASGLIVAGLVAGTLIAPKYVPGWGDKLNWDGALTVFLVAFAMFGFFMIIRSNIALSQARAEVGRLAAENERTRIARDLHDLLGHSLTTITVKAGLARKLAERGDPERAAAEIAEVEQLTRRALGEVRAVVAGYREVTLSGELVSARELLRAAGIEATLPGAIDSVDPDAAETFGWVVREAVTNVVRHSGADHCTISLGPRWIEVADDGPGTAVGGAAGATAGNGLRGLRERLAALGGNVVAHRTSEGWLVRAELAATAGRDAQSRQPAGALDAR